MGVLLNMKKIILMTFVIVMLTANIAFGIEIVDVACGKYYIVLLAEDGTVWTMGDNTCGKCGHSTEYTKIQQPKQIMNIPKMLDVLVGNKDSSTKDNYTILVGEDGTAYKTSSDGRLKVGSLSDTLYTGGSSISISEGKATIGSTPMYNLYAKNIVAAASGGSHQIFIDDEGDV